MLKNLLSFCLLLAAIPMQSQTGPADYVHPLVGSANEGQTYPAAGVPFAMTHWSPQTRAGEIKCVAPYYFGDRKIQGFRGTHFMSGSCVPDYGSFTLAPGMGALKTNAVERASSFDRATEHAAPYAYSVELKDAGVKAEITGTLRAGAMRFQFTRDDDAWVVIENNARGGDGWVRVDAAKQEVTGEVPVRREYAGSGKLAGFSGYFVVEFSKPFADSGAFAGAKIAEGKAEQRGDGQPVGVVRIPAISTAVVGASKAVIDMPTGSPRPGFGGYVRFPGAHAGDVVVARTGTSFVSVDEARRNLRAEIPGFDFDAVKQQARAAWNRSLGQIEVKDDIPARTIFYTAMYHALLHPRTLSDVDGSYPAFASMGRIAHADGFTYYDDFSMWDIFRAQLPLLTLLDPQRSVDFVRSLMAKGDEGGFLPIFPAWNSYTSEMVGDHASVAILDAWRKGLRGFDIEHAYGQMRKNATELPKDRAEYIDGKGRRGLDSYLKYGYIPLEDHIGDAFHKNEQVSRTLEYAFDDAMIGALAKDLGKDADAALFTGRGQNWRKVIDPQTGFARGRLANGAWVSPFEPAGKYSWITEGTPWVYTFFVPQDVPGLIALEGGPKRFEEKLDRLFDGKYYDHGNEPSHHIAYLYDAAGAPAKTQAHVRALMESEYRDGPGGLAGNDDAGQMSAWYVLSALGFYQVAPGVPEYWLGSPRFHETTVLLPSGERLRVIAKGAADGKVYVRRVTFNGTEIAGFKLRHAQLAGGGVLEFEMSAQPPVK
ncbi:GH92 family glycosyl hydrolase [Granulicella rosea]|uniref:GH92 family glycosyl hydrolase n=1 Tax=Granulicella rosea TaxID=474952 RepID=UPI001FE37D75|nr:GH92 family glycosyl hydrolase [Granulicella rosea]